MSLFNKEKKINIKFLSFNLLFFLILKKSLLLHTDSLIAVLIFTVLINLILKKNELKQKELIALGGIIGATIFCILLGIKVINPCYTEWLLGRGGDPAQHFIGWNFYRNSTIQWPITFMDNYGVPGGTLVGFTDSIPILAIPLRFINSILPYKFQYIGLFIFICYILQGCFSAAIAKKITSNKYGITLIVMLFCTSSIMLWRAYGHEALMAHWLLLWAINIYIDPDMKHNYWQWFLLFPIVVFIHPYFIPMVYFVYVLYLISYYKDYKKVNIIKFFIVNACIIVSMYICGYLHGGNAEGTGYGFYSFNLNSFINPESWSTIFRSRPIGSGQYEGINYLGAGIIILITVLILKGYFKIKELKNNKLEILVCILLVLFAASNIITFDNTILFRYPLISMHRKLGEIFRSSGRLVWPLYYLIIYYTIKTLFKYYTNKRLILLLSCITLIQVYDYNTKFYEMKKMYTVDYKWESKLQDNEWEKIKEEYNTIRLTENNNDYIDFAEFASYNNMNLNVGYFARTYASDIDPCVVAKEQIYENKLDKNSIYVIFDDDTKKIAEKNYPDKIKIIDGYYLLCS